MPVPPDMPSDEDFLPLETLRHDLPEYVGREFMTLAGGDLENAVVGDDEPQLVFAAPVARLCHDRAKHMARDQVCGERPGNSSKAAVVERDFNVSDDAELQAHRKVAISAQQKELQRWHGQGGMMRHQRVPSRR